jgi:hypothetical protein
MRTNNAFKLFRYITLAVEDRQLDLSSTVGTTMTYRYSIRRAICVHPLFPVAFDSLASAPAKE